MRGARRQQPRDHAPTADAQGIAAARLGKIPIVAELPAIEIHHRVAGHHQGIGQRDVLESEWLEDVMIVSEGHACRSVVEAVVGDIQRRVLNPLPCSGHPRLLQILLERKIQLEIQRCRDCRRYARDRQG